MGLSTLYDVTEPVPPMVSPWTVGWGFVDEGIADSAPSAGGFESGQRIVYHPLYVPTLCVAKRMWWANGNAPDAGYTFEMGIYRDGGHKPSAKLVATGSVYQGNASEIQFADITDTILTPNLYWLSFCAGQIGSGSVMRSTTSASWDELHRMHQASISPGSSPATATPVESDVGYAYLFGFATTA